MKIVAIILAFLLCLTTVLALGEDTNKFCEKEGYTIGAKGCTFPDGRACDPKEFLKGKCGQKYTSCVQKGFKVNSRSDIGLCIFPDKRECGLDKFSDGLCKFVPPAQVTSGFGGSRDLSQYLADKRSQRFTKPDCKKEGESIPIIQNPPKCCAGLQMIRPMDKSLVGTRGICTAKCGNRVCDSLESKVNCPRDCKK